MRCSLHTGESTTHLNLGGPKSLTLPIPSFFWAARTSSCPRKESGRFRKTLHNPFCSFTSSSKPQRCQVFPTLNQPSKTHPYPIIHIKLTTGDYYYLYQIGTVVLGTISIALACAEIHIVRLKPDSDEFVWSAFQNMKGVA